MQIMADVSCMQVLIHHHKDEEPSTRVYRKVINTDRILCFDRRHPMACSINSLETLFSTHHSRIKDHEERKLFNVIRVNCYATDVVQRYAKQITSGEEPQYQRNCQKSKWRSILYINTVSEATAGFFAAHGKNKLNSTFCG